MKKLLLIVVLLLISRVSLADAWITITPNDLSSIQIAQTPNTPNQPEGLYLSLNKNIEGPAASYCPRKDFLVITNPKLIDRAYSSILLAISTQKTFKVYADGSGNCAFGGPVATILTLIP